MNSIIAELAGTWKLWAAGAAAFVAIILLLLLRYKKGATPHSGGEVPLSKALSATRGNILGRIKRAFSAANQDVKKQIEEVLYTSDVGVTASKRLLDALKEEGAYDSVDHALEVLEGCIKDILPPDADFKVRDCQKPCVVMLVGVNGVGKTTTIAKLAGRYKREGLSVILAAADTYRKAAIEQLCTWGDRLGVPVIKQDYGSDPGAVAFDAVKAAMARKADIVFIDTAGRLHTKKNLMEELKKVKRVCNKALEGAPHHIWLVVDATTGQNAISQAEEFNSAVGLTGVVITKLDGTAKGGVLIGISDKLNIPIYFIGVGERDEDLRPFKREEFISALLREDNGGKVQ